MLTAGTRNKLSLVLTDLKIPFKLPAAQCACASLNGNWLGTSVEEGSLGSG